MESCNDNHAAPAGRCPPYAQNKNWKRNRSRYCSDEYRQHCGDLYSLSGSLSEYQLIPLPLLQQLKIAGKHYGDA